MISKRNNAWLEKVKTNYALNHNLLQFKIKNFNKNNEKDRKQRPSTWNLLSIVSRREKIKTYNQFHNDNLLQSWANDENFNSYSLTWNNFGAQNNINANIDK